MSRIIKMGDVMRALKNVAGATMLTPDQCWELAQALSKEDAFEPVPVITDHSVERQDVLPCDVRLAPATTIRKGCKVETLMRCIELRKGQLPEFTAFKSSAPHEPAELQATIAQMAEEVKRIKTISDNYSALLMDANAEIERLKSESFEELYNAVIDERDALAERLKGGQGEAVAVLMLGEVFHGTNGPEVDDWDINWDREVVEKLAVGHPGENFELFASPPAPVAVVHPFADKVISKLQRFEECASDPGADGVDIGRHWLDLLTQLGLLNRVQRSPALWEITQQGDDCLDKVKELNR